MKAYFRRFCHSSDMCQKTVTNVNASKVPLRSCHSVTVDLMVRFIPQVKLNIASSWCWCNMQFYVQKPCCWRPSVKKLLLKLLLTLQQTWCSRCSQWFLSLGTRNLCLNDVWSGRKLNVKSLMTTPHYPMCHELKSLTELSKWYWKNSVLEQQWYNGTGSSRYCFCLHWSQLIMDYLYLSCCTRGEPEVQCILWRSYGQENWEHQR